MIVIIYYYLFVLIIQLHFLLLNFLFLILTIDHLLIILTIDHLLTNIHQLFCPINSFSIVHNFHIFIILFPILHLIPYRLGMMHILLKHQLLIFKSLIQLLYLPFQLLYLLFTFWVRQHYLYLLQISWFLCLFSIVLVISCWFLWFFRFLLLLWYLLLKS